MRKNGKIGEMPSLEGERKRMFERREISEQEVQLEVRGSLDSPAAEQFQIELNRIAGGDHKTITLELSEVPTINSTCIGKILLLRKSLAEQDRSIRIRGCSDALYNIFHLIDLDKRISIDR
jgi:anti-anti-sigma factor